MRSPAYEVRDITEYVELEAEGEAVRRAEKVASERIAGRQYDVWDVQTDATRWWVITNPTNLYSQEEHPSMDYLLSFHVGLMFRVMARQQPSASEDEQDRLATPFRRWQQAADALERADEAEEFQAVGMRCRECLIALVRDLARDEMVPNGESPPQASNVVKWTEFIANHIASGSSNSRLRSYIKSLTKETWDLVAWLTHASNATRFDGILAVDATDHVLAMFSMALIRFERPAPDRCPKCSSYRLTSVYRPELNRDPPYITLCESCDWEDI